MSKIGIFQDIAKNLGPPQTGTYGEPKPYINVFFSSNLKVPIHITIKAITLLILLKNLITVAKLNKYPYN